uniref:Uncharacterized protein n=1 Tax=Apteryx owenii TaxID=8824 RepID=A0A8B9PWX3_APTOW
GLENIGNFIKAITLYGVKPHDIFEANDLFENTNHTQVQSTLIALASQVRRRGAPGGGPQGVPKKAWRSPRGLGGPQGVLWGSGGVPGGSLRGLRGPQGV